AARVSVADRLADLLEHSQEARQVVSWSFAFAEQSSERASVHEFHGEKWAAPFVGTQFVNWHEAGVLQLAADLCFLVKAAEHFGVATAVGEQHLDRQVAAQSRIAATQHGSHAAAANLAMKFEAAKAVLGHGRIFQGLWCKGYRQFGSRRNTHRDGR